MNNDLRHRVAIITGASRGIGKAIALKFAAHGIDIAIGAKTVESSAKTPGSIHETVEAVEKLGSKALAIRTDVRKEDQVADLVKQTYDTFGRIDILVNNAGAIFWESVEKLPVKLFDLMMQINYRAPFVLCHEALPYLRERGGGHIINLSPAPKIGSLAVEKWQNRTGYLMSKFGMSHLTMGLAEELRELNISANALWPRNIIDTQATRVFAKMFQLRKETKWYSPELMADASLEIVKSDPAELTGEMLIAEDFLRERGQVDLERYRVESP